MKKFSFQYIVLFFLLGFFEETLIAQTQTPSVRVAVTTSTHGGQYKPRNCTVIWISDAKGKFIKTIGLWAKNHRNELDTWAVSSVGNKNLNGNDNGILKSTKNWDGTTAASRKTHGLVTGMWDLKDSTGKAVPPGKYRYHIEMTESHSQGPYAFGEFTVGSSVANRTGVDSGNAVCRACVSNVTLTYMGSGADNVPPSISGVQVKSQNSVEILFSEPIDKVNATNLTNLTLNYKSRITDTSVVKNLKIKSVKLNEVTKTLTVTTDSMYSDEMYTLELKSQKDLATPANTAGTLKVSFEYQEVFNVNLAENLPMVFDKSLGTGLGTTASTFFVVPQNPANIQWASIRANIEGLEDTLQASFYVNSSPAYFIAHIGASNGALSWGDIDFNKKFLVNGINELKVKFNNDLKGTTTGFRIENLEVQYEIYVTRKSGLVTNRTKSMALSEQIQQTQQKIYFENHKNENTLIRIYNSKGLLVNELPRGSFEWDYKNASGELVKRGIYRAVYQTGEVNKSISFAIVN